MFALFRMYRKTVWIIWLFFYSTLQLLLLFLNNLYQGFNNIVFPLIERTGDRREDNENRRWDGSYESVLEKGKSIVNHPLVCSKKYPCSYTCSLNCTALCWMFISHTWKPLKKERREGESKGDRTGKTWSEGKKELWEMQEKATGEWKEKKYWFFYLIVKRKAFFHLTGGEKSRVELSEGSSEGK